MCSLVDSGVRLVNAPRRWYHRAATDLRNVGVEESVMEPCLWTFRNDNGVIQALCVVDVDGFILACSDSPFGKRILDGINHLYEWGTWESRVSVRRAHRRFEISFTEFMKEISPINLPSHRRHAT